VRTLKGALIALALGVAIGVGATMQLSSREDAPAPASGAPPAAVAERVPAELAPAPIVGLPDFVRLAERLSPVVVNISTRSQPKGETSPRGLPGPGGQSPFGEGDPREFWEPFERFFGPMPRQRRFRQRSLGSGFILDAEGYIATNNHVIEDADEIVVRLDDNREFKASVVGRDAKTDLAVLRIEGAQSLAAATLGDSDGLRVGEWVMAIGNPFGLDHSVTAGIVSAKGRFIGAGNYDDYIQTDAAINPGNSGGPLLNLRGEVVGINSAIFSRTGGNIGIGFAIPVNLAKELIPQLKEKGRVTRGWLGVLIQRVTPEIAESLGLDEARGALVADVVTDGPAKASGMKVGDVIVEYDGQAINESNELPLMVARTPVGKEVVVEVIRDKQRVTLTITIAELKDEEVEVASAAEGPSLGLTVQTLTPEIAENLGVEETAGVVVTAVEGGSPAEDAGLRRGDIVLEVNRRAVKDANAYRKAIRESEQGKNLLFLVRRGENTIFLALKPPS
jgi:serine protease Do